MLQSWRGNADCGYAGTCGNHFANTTSCIPFWGSHKQHGYQTPSHPWSRQRCIKLWWEQLNLSAERWISSCDCSLEGPELLWIVVVWNKSHLLITFRNSATDKAPPTVLPHITSYLSLYMHGYHVIYIHNIYRNAWTSVPPCITASPHGLQTLLESHQNRTAKNGHGQRHFHHIAPWAVGRGLCGSVPSSAKSFKGQWYINGFNWWSHPHSLTVSTRELAFLPGKSFQSSKIAMYDMSASVALIPKTSETQSRRDTWGIVARVSAWSFHGSPLSSERSWHIRGVLSLLLAHGTSGYPASASASGWKLLAFDQVFHGFPRTLVD